MFRETYALTTRSAPLGDDVDIRCDRELILLAVVLGSTCSFPAELYMPWAEALGVMSRCTFVLELRRGTIEEEPKSRQSYVLENCAHSYFLSYVFLNNRRATCR